MQLLKKKVSIKESILVIFLITGSLSMASIDGQLKNHEGRLSDVEATTGENQEAIDRLLDTYENHAGKIKNLNDNILENKENLEYQRQAIANIAVQNKEILDKKLATRESLLANYIALSADEQNKDAEVLDAHENRISDVEATTGENQEAIDKLMDKTDKHEEKLKKTEEKLNQNKEILEKKIIDGNKKNDKINEEQNSKLVAIDNKITNHEKNINKTKEQLSSQEIKLAQSEEKINNNEKAIGNLNNRMDNIEDKFNKGMSLMAAMTAIDFQNIENGEIGIGAGVGHYENSEGVAVGIAYAPTDSLRVNARYSVSTADINTSAIGVGATYKFRVK